MARIRTVKPEFFRHIGIQEAEAKTGLPLRLAFIGLWTVADREGRFVWEPRNLKLDIMPHDKVDFAKIMDTLAEYEFVNKYEVAGQVFGEIPSWHKHQFVNSRETESKIPEASAGILMHVQEYGEGKGREREREGRVDDFKPFWEAWPKRVGKDKALKAWNKLSTEERYSAMQALPSHKKQTAWTKDNGQYIPHPATWLNGKRWQDEIGIKPAQEKPCTHAGTGYIQDGFCTACAKRVE